jgi:hypothetical protein
MSKQDKNDQQRSKPSFSGNTMPMNINPNIGLDHGVGDEITRRVGVFQPSFESLSSFEPTIMSIADNRGSKDPIPDEGILIEPTPAPRPPPKGGIWRLDRVPTLPDFHPLERTSVFVSNVIHPSDVSMRISDVLRDRSIDAKYDNFKAKALCTTMEGVDFRVRLYGGRGEYEHGIIVEVQRRFGTSNSFYNDTVAILNAAEGKGLQPTTTPLSSSDGNNIPLVDDDLEYTADGTSSLEMISKMFNYQEIDAHLLALQTLVSLTDVNKMGNKTARAVSKELFRLENDNVVGAKVLSLIVDKQEEDDTFKLRSLALNVAANAFEAVDGQYAMMLKEQLRRVLLHELRSAKDNPRNAVYAARIIKFFVPQDNGSDVYSALEAAHKVGASRNALLEHYVQLCLDKFD